jgi:hypothetical protein
MRQRRLDENYKYLSGLRILFVCHIELFTNSEKKKKSEALFSVKTLHKRDVISDMAKI